MGWAATADGAEAQAALKVGPTVDRRTLRRGVSRLRDGWWTGTGGTHAHRACAGTGADAVRERELDRITGGGEPRQFLSFQDQRVISEREGT